MDKERVEIITDVKAESGFDAADNDQAIAEYTAALRIDPSDVCTLTNRGGAYLIKGEHDRAIADLKAALRIDPDYTEAKEALQDARRNKARME